MYHRENSSANLTAVSSNWLAVEKCLLRFVVLVAAIQIFQNHKDIDRFWLKTKMILSL